MNDNCDASKASRSQGETSKNCANQNHKTKKKVDMKEVQCYCCKKLDHYDRDSYYNKNNDEDNGVAQFAHDGNSESEDVILMAAIDLAYEKSNMWYHDTGCNNHMTRSKN